MGLVNMNISVKSEPEPAYIFVPDPVEELPTAENFRGSRRRSRNSRKMTVLEAAAKNIVLSKQGAPLLYIGHREYRRGNPIKAGCTWRCTTSKCPGRMLVVDGDSNYKLTRECIPHPVIDRSKKSRREAKKLRVHMKQKKSSQKERTPELAPLANGVQKVLENSSDNLQPIGWADLNWPARLRTGNNYCFQTGFYLLFCFCWDVRLNRGNYIEMNHEGPVHEAVNRLGLGAFYEEILYIIHLKSKFDWPWELVSLLPSVAFALTGHPTQISAEQIRLVYDEIVGGLGMKSEYLCGICGTPKALLNDRCVSPGCANHLSKKSTNAQSICHLQFDVASQFTTILEKHGHNVIRNHALIHDGQRVFRDEDIRSKPGFLNHVEPDMDALTLVLPVCLHFDGTQFTKKSKSSDWPFTLGLLDLPPAERFRIENLVFVCCLSTYKKPKSKHVEAIMAKAKYALNSLTHIGVSLTFLLNGQPTDFRFKIKIVGLIADLEAMSLGLRFTNRGYCGCPFCLIRGVHHNGAVRFETVAHALRTEVMDRLNSMARPGLNGYRDGPTEIMKFVTGCKLFMDPLHILDEGFLKDMLVDLCGKGTRNATRRRPELRFSNDILTRANSLASICRWPTYAPGRLRPIEDCCFLVNGKERRATLFCILPVILAVSPLDSDVAEAWLLLVLLNHRRLMDRFTPDHVLRSVGEIITELGRLYMEIFGLDWVTVKMHIYFAHSLLLLLLYGNYQDTDTTSFEHLLGYLKREGSCHATHGYLESSFARSHAMTASANEVNGMDDIAMQLSPLISVKDSNAEWKGARGGEVISPHLAIPKNAVLPLQAAVGHLYYGRLLRSYPGIRCVSRVLWRKQALSVEDFWPSPPTTEQTLVCVSIRGEFRFGKLLALGVTQRRGVLKSVIDCYNIVDPFSEIKGNLRTTGTATSLRLRELLNMRDVNQYVGEVAHGPCHTLVCGESQIVGLAMLVPFNNRVFITCVPARCLYV